MLATFFLTLACTLVDPTSHQVLWQVLWQATYPRQATYPNSPQGVQSLIERTPHQAAWVMEPTGRYSLLVASLSPPCRQAGEGSGPASAVQVLFKCCSSAVGAEPTSTLVSAVSAITGQDQAKTDRLDSKGRAYFALAQPWHSPGSAAF